MIFNKYKYRSSDKQMIDAILIWESISVKIGLIKVIFKFKTSIVGDQKYDWIFRRTRVISIFNLTNWKIHLCLTYHYYDTTSS